MKSIAAGLIVAALLVAAGTISLGESRHARRLAEAHERLATLQYTDEGDLASDATLRGPAAATPIGLGLGHRSAARAPRSPYWLARYTSLTDMTNAGNGPAPTDPELLFLAANAAFRTSAPQSKDAKGAVVAPRHRRPGLRRCAAQGPGPGRRGLQLRVRREAARPDRKGTDEGREGCKEQTGRTRGRQRRPADRTRRSTVGPAVRPRGNR